MLLLILYEERAHLGQHSREVVCLLVVLKSLREEIIVLLAEGLLHRRDVQRCSGLLGLRHVCRLISWLQRWDRLSVKSVDGGDALTLIRMEAIRSQLRQHTQH